MKTPAKKKRSRTLNTKGKVNIETDSNGGIYYVTDLDVITPTPYELFRNKKGEWEWRKRGRNRRILNHRYNTKQAAIKGMKADYDVTVGMGGFDYKEIK